MRVVGAFCLVSVSEWWEWAGIDWGEAVSERASVRSRRGSVSRGGRSGMRSVEFFLRKKNKNKNPVVWESCVGLLIVRA